MLFDAKTRNAHYANLAIQKGSRKREEWAERLRGLKKHGRKCTVSHQENKTSFTILEMYDQEFGLNNRGD